MLELRADTVIERQGVGASTLQLEGHVAGDALLAEASVSRRAVSGSGHARHRPGIGTCGRPEATTSGRVCSCVEAHRGEGAP